MNVPANMGMDGLEVDDRPGSTSVFKHVSGGGAVIPLSTEKKEIHEFLHGMPESYIFSPSTWL